MDCERITLRIPTDLYKEAQKAVSERKTRDPGASMNSLIVAALHKYLTPKGGTAHVES